MKFYHFVLLALLFAGPVWAADSCPGTTYPSQTEFRACIAKKQALAAQEERKKFQTPLEPVPLGQNGAPQEQ